MPAVPRVLPLYLARAFGGALALILAVFLALGLTGELIELARRAAPRPELGLGTVFVMALLKLPALLFKLLPFAVLFAAMLALYRLDRHRELVAVRAAGQSAWGFLSPILMAAALLGFAAAWIGQPATTLATARFQDLEQRHFKNASGSIWLRQPEAEGWSIAQVQALDGEGKARDLTIFAFDSAGRLTLRADAARGRLLADGWHLEDVLLTGADGTSRQAAGTLPTRATPADLRNAAGLVRPVSVWGLPDLIARLEASGLSAVRQRLDLQSAFALPLLLAAAALLAAPLILPRWRRPGPAWPLLGGLSAGFVLLVFSDVTAAFGAAGSLPVGLSAWAPVLVAGGFGTALLLHLEGA